MVAKTVPPEATEDNPVPSYDTAAYWLRRLLHLLKPLGVVTGAGSNRLSVDVNNIVTGAVSTVTTLVNQTNIGGTNAFEVVKNASRVPYTTSLRNRL